MSAVENTPITPDAPSMAQDLLDGMKAVSDFTGMPERRCYYLAERKLLPGVFKQGSRWIGLKSVIRESYRAQSVGAA
jgi:hypothetical protein